MSAMIRSHIMLPLSLVATASVLVLYKHWQVLRPICKLQAARDTAWQCRMTKGVIRPRPSFPCSLAPFSENKSLDTQLVSVSVERFTEDCGADVATGLPREEDSLLSRSGEHALSLREQGHARCPRRVHSPATALRMFVCSAHSCSQSPS